MRKYISIITCLTLIISCIATGCGTADQVESQINMSDVFVENSGYIDRIAVFQDGVCTENNVDEIDEVVEIVFETLSKEQKNMGAIDGKLMLSVADAQAYLTNQQVAYDEYVASSYLAIEKQYVLITLDCPCTFVLEGGYSIECDLILVDPEEQLVHWSQDGEFVGTVGYF